MPVLSWGAEKTVTFAGVGSTVTRKVFDVAALNDGGYVMVWVGTTPDPDKIFGQRFDAAGDPVGAEFEVGASVTGNNKSEVVVTSLADGGFAVGFTDGANAGDQWFERFNSSGAVQQTVQWDFIGVASAELDPAIARFGTGFLLAEVDSGDIWVRRFDASGTGVTLNGNDFLLVNVGAGTGTQERPSIAGLAGDGRFVVSWYDDNDISYKFRVFNADGTAVTGVTMAQDVVSGGVSARTNNVTALANGGFVVTWQEANDPNAPDTSLDSIRARIYNANGAPVSGTIQVNALYDGYQTQFDVVSMPNGNFFISWSDYTNTGTNGNIAGQLFDSFGNRIGTQVTISSQSSPDDAWPKIAALADGRLAVMWTEFNTKSIKSRIIDPRDGLVNGTAAGETLYGNDLLNDDMKGFGGNDFLYGLEGNDQIDGGDGADLVDGGNGNDFLYGNTGTDTLLGGDGNDLLVGGAGADVLNGGAGRDVASYITAAAGVLLNLNNVALNTGDAAGDTYSGIEVYVGSNFLDEFIGSNVADEFWGSYGNDIIRGNGGNDSLYGGWGLDTLEGGAGADYLDGGQERDIASYASATAGLRASLADTSVNTGDAAGDTYVNIEGLAGSAFGDDLIGDANANFLFGGGGNDTLWGQGGSDELYGEAGNDWLIGGTGADKLDGGADFDTVRYSFASTGLRADLKDSWTNTGDAAGDTYFAVEALVGSDFNDLLLGDDGNNEIWGDYGDDQIWGRGGNDQLSGGNGLDTFNFTTGWGNDTIIDYKVGGAEKLNFSGVAGLTNFGQLAVTVGGTGTTVSFGGNTVFLQNIFSFTASDCVF